MNEHERYINDTQHKRKIAIEAIARSESVISAAEKDKTLNMRLLEAYDIILSNTGGDEKPKTINTKSNYDRNASWTNKWIFGLTEIGYYATTKEVANVLDKYEEDDVYKINQKLSPLTGNLQDRGVIRKAQIHPPISHWGLADWFINGDINPNYLRSGESQANKLTVSQHNQWYPKNFVIKREVLGILKKSNDVKTTSELINELKENFEFISNQLNQDREPVRKAVSGVLSRMKEGKNKEGLFTRFKKKGTIYYSLK